MTIVDKMTIVDRCQLWGVKFTFFKSPLLMYKLFHDLEYLDKVPSKFFIIRLSVHGR